MKLVKSIWMIGLMLGMSLVAEKCEAQAQELEELALDIEKLAQFKKILSDLQKGYQILSTGYSSVKSIAQGNFEIHKAFLDGLLSVNPAVQKYQRVADIIECQVEIVKEYKSALQNSKSSGVFTGGEIGYMSTVYSNLVDGSLKNLDDLITVITANKLRMSDDERIKSINNIYTDMQDKITFLRHFNNTNSVLALQRMHEQNDAERMMRIYNMN